MAQVQIIERPEWGARAPRNRTHVSWDTRTEFIVHHSAGPTTQTVRSIQDFHLNGRGWSDIGYNLLVDNAGNAYEGRGWQVAGAHAQGHNTSGIGVCYIGENSPTPAAKRTIRALYEEATRRAGRTLTPKGHRDVNETSCPGDNLNAWVHDGMLTDGLDTTEEDPLIGLSKGDTGEAVTALQALITYVDDTLLSEHGIDGHYGSETAAGLLAVRASVGSAAEPGWGDSVTGYAYAQLMRAVARAEAGGGGTATLPDTVTVSGDLNVED